MSSLFNPLGHVREHAQIEEDDTTFPETSFNSSMAPRQQMRAPASPESRWPSVKTRESPRIIGKRVRGMSVPARNSSRPGPSEAGFPLSPEGMQPNHKRAGGLDATSALMPGSEENRAPYASTRSASPIKLIRRDRTRDVVGDAAASARTTPVGKHVYATGLGSPVARGKQAAAWPRLSLWTTEEDSHESKTPKGLGSAASKAKNSGGQRMVDLFLSNRRKQIEGCDEVEAFV
ncbi:hypothetical protein SODALDRAFT_108484 [Sodiomyces alkalinus F11]|uniref:Uncharacterized protein n=1 Tax=Sodiomyces alkalinus (strain CBS 110278 / VKM F-3762 / F11) TaxID=1314773 RepID=A0A3N2Q2G7_SODAK|nr:hypothetical protein SODALDRAFT_108484 [Sodiomyces alkalinus F11]ROT40953.1 hypothetical protein SODALDRAFT_108484 [Sodiomyces alkalinus F11]